MKPSIRRRNAITRDLFVSNHSKLPYYFVKVGERKFYEGESLDTARKEYHSLEQQGHTVRIEKLFAGSLEVIE